MKRIRALAEAMAGVQAHEVRKRFSDRLRAAGERGGDEAADVAALLSGAYPALGPAIEARPEDVLAILRSGTKAARDSRTFRRILLQLVGDVTDGEAVRRG